MIYCYISSRYIFCILPIKYHCLSLRTSIRIIQIDHVSLYLFCKFNSVLFQEIYDSNVKSKKEEESWIVHVFLAEDSEGWETVQRGKLKSRGSPSQRSQVPGSPGVTVETFKISQQHTTSPNNNIRPNSALKNEESQELNINKTKENEADGASSPRSPSQMSPAYRDALLSPPKRESMNQALSGEHASMRSRTNSQESKDSEKENRPASEANMKENALNIVSKRDKPVVQQFLKSDLIENAYDVKKISSSDASPCEDEESKMEEELRKFQESTDEEKEEEEEALRSELENVGHLLGHSVWK